LVPAAGVPQDLFDDIFESDPSPSKHAAGKSPEPNANSESNRSTNDLDILADGSAPLADDSLFEEDNPFGEAGDEDVLAGIEIPTIDSDDDNPLAGDDPFEVVEGASLKVDGLGDLFGHADVYGIKCKVCDTRIHVRPDQSGQQVECPECFSKVLVSPPQKNPKPAQRWVKEGRDKTAKKDDELKLSDPVTRPPIEVDLSYGLSAPDVDLLAPKQSASPDVEIDAGDSEIRLADNVEVNSKDRSPPKDSPACEKQNKKRSLSRRELYKESQRRQDALDAGQEYRPEQNSAVGSKKEFPEFNFGSLLTSAIEMLKSPGVGLRTVVALTLMCLGSIMMQWFSLESAAEPAADEATSSFVKGLIQSLSWLAFGFLPYLIGLAALWYTSAYLFRDAALGHLEIKSWKSKGRSELLGTFLIFSFGFFIAGLAGIFRPPSILPMQILFAPLLLLGAWYNQSPFAIINVDAFKMVGIQKTQWIEFYKFIFALLVASFVTSSVFVLRLFVPDNLFVLNAIVTIVGLLMTVVITLLFAAVCGWHCGKVVDELENQPTS
jgi:DNA-directed RNA polymerase subunit RPC12/RpoP